MARRKWRRRKGLESQLLRSSQGRTNVCIVTKNLRTVALWSGTRRIIRRRRLSLVLFALRCLRRKPREKNISPRMRLIANSSVIDQCPYIAKRIKYLRYHMKKHRKEYSAFCEPCQEGFFSRDKLETHNIAKHGAQPYQCETCRKLFLSKYSLFTHNKKHLPLEERLHYQCELCGKSFNNKQTFRLVLTQHSQSNAYFIKRLFYENS